VITKVKTHWIEKFLVSLKISWKVDVKNGFAVPFEYLKHKLWPKEGSRVKVPI
jgi:hypothetical protein